MLQSMGLQRVRHDWATELNWTEQTKQSCRASKTYEKVWGTNSVFERLLVVKLRREGSAPEKCRGEGPTEFTSSPSHSTDVDEETLGEKRTCLSPPSSKWQSGELNLEFLVELSLISSTGKTRYKKKAIVKQLQNTQVSGYKLNYLYVLPIVKEGGGGWSPTLKPQALLGIREEKATFGLMPVWVTQTMGVNKVYLKFWIPTKVIPTWSP